MRLYLSSFRMGDSFPELLRLAGGRPRVALVANALDFIDDAARRRYAETVYSPADEFRSAGLEVLEVDLRTYFGRTEALADSLTQTDLIWLTGGNTFLLRRAMAASGLDAIVRRRVADDTLVYGGESAGAMLASRTLDGIELMDDPTVQADGYPDLVPDDGLGLVDFTVVPHCNSPHIDGEAAGRMVAYFSERELAHKPLRDGDVVVVEGDAVTLRPRRIA